jgi:hypothetical protein
MGINPPSKTDHKDAGFHARTDYAHRSYYALRVALSSMRINGLRSISVRITSPPRTGRCQMPGRASESPDRSRLPVPYPALERPLRPSRRQYTRCGWGMHLLGRQLRSSHLLQTPIGSSQLVKLRRTNITGPNSDQRYWRAMFNFRIRDCKVVRFMPRRAAAPSGPPTWPFASSSAFMIACRSVA